MNTNPFAVVSPEELTAEQANQLFVEMNSDYPEITRPGNTLICGARGSGKSMSIRCAMPDFLMVRDRKNFSELPYLAISVSVKKTSLNLQELQKLNNLHIPYLINEHFFVLQVVMQTFHSLSKIKFEEEKYDREKYESFFKEIYRYLKASGYKGELNANFDNPNSFFDSLYEELFLLSCDFIPYLSSLFNTDSIDFKYDMPLLSFNRFIIPIFKKLINLPGFPNGKPILLFIDDADNLSTIQTEILNSWLASRTQPTISLKVSTQIGGYKTHLTSNGILVESPHDYQEVNISFLYTTSSAVNRNYYEKASQILIKRLKLHGYADNIDISDKKAVKNFLNEFFPSYKIQEEGIKTEQERIKSLYNEHGRGNTVYDDIRRYAIPNYIRDLGGNRKSRSTYRYAGIENIIHLSSGIIRYLLDATAKMYDTVMSSGDNVKNIPTDIQNEVMRNKADFYLFTELRKAEEIAKQMSSDNVLYTTDTPKSLTDKLSNLINAMGKTFHEILVSGSADIPFSGRAERKVFSVAFSNPSQVSEEIKAVFELGVRLGFLHESYIGNKAGTGRTNLYILNRCFAPIFTLDPTGFQGYLFVTSSDLELAISNGKQLKNINDKLSDSENELYQITFEDLGD